MDKEVKKKDVAKAYEKYSQQFTPRPAYFANSVRAFLTGGALCTAAFYAAGMLTDRGVSKEDASIWVTVGIVVLAQLLTGFGVFDTIARFAGAGVIVPISGFANSMVAPAIEYKKEGLVLGVGAKLFSVAGPVLVCGITAATGVGIIYWIIGLF
ncbi:MAG: SpoVA/SpoVAEb family sporulation membrane protein [Emergencia sp.]